MNEKRRKRAVSVPPRLIWARRIKIMAIFLALCLLGVAGGLLLRYKPPAQEALPTARAASPAASRSPSPAR